MIFAGSDGVIRVWNPAAERIFGFTAEAAIG
jgi:PAS domain S-box-containing protein